MLTDRVKNHKSQGGEVLSYVESCPFCYQNVMIEHIPGMAEKEIQQLVIEACTCDEAMDEAKKRQRIEQLENKLDQVLTEEENKLIKDRLWTVGVLVCDMTIDKLTINIDKKNKMTIKRNSKGNVVIEREIKNTLQQVF